MPKTKHHKKKYPNSEWVRRRNIRKMSVSKQNSLEKKTVMEGSKENTEKTLFQQQEKKQKSLLNAIRNAFVGQIKNTKDAV